MSENKKSTELLNIPEVTTFQNSIVRRSDLMFVTFMLLAFMVACTITILYFDFTPEKRPLPQIVLDFIGDIPIMMIAACFGGVGSLLKASINRRKKSELGVNHNQADYHYGTFGIGAFVGIISFFAIQSHVILKLVYKDLPSTQVEFTYHGIVLVAAIAGYLSIEIGGVVTNIARKHLDSGDK